MQKDETLAVLARALGREATAVRELRESLVRQREGVASDSIETVHRSCDDIGRLLVTLDAAKPSSLRDPPGFRARRRDVARRPLRIAGRLPAAALWRKPVTCCARRLRQPPGEAAVNRVVLQRTVEAGEAFLQALFAGAGERDPVYRAGERRDDDGSGFLIDRTA